MPCIEKQRYDELLEVAKVNSGMPELTEFLSNPSTGQVTYIPDDEYRLLRSLE